MLCLLAMRLLPHTGGGMDSSRLRFGTLGRWQQWQVPRCLMSHLLAYKYTEARWPFREVS